MIGTTGCLPPTRFYGGPPPELKEFGNQYIFTKDIAQPAMSLRGFVRERLWEKRWKSKEESSDPYTFVITWYLAEPYSDDEPRFRQTAFLIRISQSARDSLCSEIAVSSVTESKGTRESTWRTTEDDRAYTSVHEQVVRDWFFIFGSCK